ncbi:MAG: hypothetical protein V4496_03355, partial [Pseudomonadota bacterium]
MKNEQLAPTNNSYHIVELSDGIDERLFAQIHNDAYLTGSYHLEGYSFGHAIGFLHQYMNSIALEKNSEKIEEIKKALIALVIYENKIQEIRADPSKEKRLSDLINSIHQDIIQLKDKEYLLIPGGWLASNGGHAMAYRCSLDQDGNLLFAIENSGAGLSFHRKKSGEEKELYNAEFTYKIPKAKIVDTQFFPKIIEQLIAAQIPKLHKQKTIEASYLYQAIFPQFAYVDGEITATDSQLWYTAGQLSGTCAIRILFKMLQPCFENRDEYRRFIFGFKLYALDKYIHLLKEKNKLCERQFHPQIKKAVHHNLKLLNLFSDTGPNTPLFDTTEKQTYFEKLDNYLQALNQFNVNTMPPDQKKEHTPPSLEWGWSSVNSIPFSSPKTTNNHYAENLDLPLKIQGGSSLFSEMDVLIKRCSHLSLNQQYAALFEQLEDFFLECPIATHNAKTAWNAFYSSLNSEETTLVFYEKINTLKAYYFSACSQLTNQKITLPRMYVVKYSIFMIIGQINQTIRLSEHRYCYYEIIAKKMSGFFCNYPDNAYLANHEPKIDSRLQTLKQASKNSIVIINFDSEIINYFLSLLNNYPELVQELEFLYRKEYDRNQSNLHQALREKKCTSLYYFTEHWDQEEIKNNKEFPLLIEKLKLQEEMEKAYLTREDAEQLAPVAIKFEKKTPLLMKSIFLTYNTPPAENTLLKTQYTLGEESRVSQILQLDTTNTEKISSNVTRLLSIDQLKEYPKKKKKYKAQGIPQTIFSAEQLENQALTDIRQCPDTQILLTIDYFNKHIKKTVSIELQTYIIANFFQPGLLIEKLNALSKEVFFRSFDAFIENGLTPLKQNNQLNIQAQFFVCLVVKVNRYAIKLNPKNYEAQLNKLYQQLNRFIENVTSNTSKAIFHYYRYRFLATVTLHEPFVNEGILHDFFLSYFYISLTSATDLNLDWAEKFQAAVDDSRQAKRLLRKHRKIISNTFLFEALQNLGIPINQKNDKITGQFPNFQVLTPSDELKYNIDAESGLVFKNELAYSQIPLSILSHPVLKQLKLNHLKTCWISIDKTMFLIEQPDISVRFIQTKSYYTIQRLHHTPGKYNQWYQLTALSIEQASEYKLDPSNILNSDALPKILKEHFIFAWIREDKQKILFFNKDNQVIYASQPIPGKESTWEMTHAENKAKMVVNRPHFLELYSSFEGSEFTLLQKEETGYTVLFPRYGLQFSASEEGETSFNLYGTDYQLKEKDAAFAHIACLQWVHEENEIALLAIQPFINQNTREETGEYYQLKQDTNAISPEKMVDHLIKENKLDIIRLWQYSGTASYFIIKIKKGLFSPQSSAQALFTCYLYLGSRQPENAWKMLDICEKELNGLAGTYEELRYLCYICTTLPYIIHEEDPDKDAIICNPDFVACQLKALALLVAQLEQKAIPLPKFDFDTKNINDLFDQHEFERTKTFYHSISDYIHDLFLKMQNMRRDMPAYFTLSDTERKKLLDFYHANSTNTKIKAIGSLGYEWTHLYFKDLYSEWKNLATRELENSASTYEQSRKNEIEDIINTHAGVFRFGSHIENKMVDLTLSSKPNYNIISKIIIHTKNIVDEIKFIKNSTSAESDMDKAVDSLSPMMPENTFFQFFLYYFLIASEPTHRHRETLRNYCKATLIVTFQSETHAQLAHWCNILYRTMCSDKPIHNIQSCDDFVEHAAQASPDPIFVATWVDDSEELLISAQALWNKQFNTSEQHYSFQHDPTDMGQNQCALYSLNNMPIVMSSSDQWNSLDKQFNENTQSGTEKYHALIKWKEFSIACLKHEETQQELAQKTRDQLTQLTDDQKIHEQALLSLANQGPEDPTLNTLWEIDITSQKRSSLNINTLLILYSQADPHKYFSATHLSRTLIIKLHTTLDQYINHELNIQQLQRIQKCLSNIKKARNAVKKQQLFFQLAKLLFARNIVSGIYDPDIIFFQHQKNILLRSRQLNNIHRLSRLDNTRKYAEIIIKMIPGEGKSTVLSPIVAQKKATGSNLVITAIPQSLLNSCHVNLFEFHREDSDLKKLKKLYANCIQAMINGNEMNTSVDMPQATELQFIDLLLSDPDKENEQAFKIWDKKVYWLDKLLTFLRNKGVLMIDEAHQGLSLKRKLNFTRKESSVVHQSIQTDMISFYQFFKYVVLKDIPEFENQDVLTLNDLLKNNKLFKNETQFKFACQALAKQLVHNEKSPLQFLINQLKEKHNQDIKIELEQYLLDQATDIPEFIALASAEVKETLALYKEQITNFLPHTLQQNQNEHYGPLNPIDSDATEITSTHMIAVPYDANNTPSKTSHFGNFLITINYTIQSILITGIPKNLLFAYFKDLLNQAKRTLYTLPHYKNINNTPEAHVFDLLVNDPHLCLSMLNSEDELLLTQLYKKLKKNDALIYEILRTDILKQIKTNAEVLSSDAYNLVDMFSSCQGMTGTPENYRTFHSRLKYNESTQEDEYIYHGMKTKQPKIHSLEFNHLNTFIAALLRQYTDADNVRAIIDISATFRTSEAIITNLEVAQAIAHYIFLNPEQFISAPIKFVLFFINGDLYALRVTSHENLSNESLIFIGSTDNRRIKERLNCTPENCFTFYSQAQRLGVDIKQAINAKALVMIDHRTLASQIRQGVLRMRDLLEGDQSFDFIVSKTLAGKSFDEIYEHAQTLEKEQLKTDLFEAAQLKMRASIRSHLMGRILSASGPQASLEKKRLMSHFYTYFVSKETATLYEKYGAINKEEDTKEILAKIKNSLIDDLEKVIASAGQTLSNEDKNNIVSTLDEILEEACALCSPRQILRHTQKDACVQIEKQIQNQNVIEKQVCNQTYNLICRENNFISYAFLILEYYIGKHQKTLNQICASTKAPFTPIFNENILVTPNFYAAYEGQTEYLNRYLKPVYAVLFFKFSGVFSCLLLSQQECSVFYEDMESLTYWFLLTTTQHIPLAQTMFSEKIPADHAETYFSMIEQIRFFNGDLSLLLNRDNNLYWLENNSKEKFEFFTQYIYPYRETPASDLQQLQALLSGFKNACHFIADHPETDKSHFDWNSKFPNLDTHGTKECEQLSQLFNSMAENWPKEHSDETNWQEKYNLSLTAHAFVNQFILKKQFFSKIYAQIKKAFAFKEQQNDKDYNVCLTQIRTLYLESPQFFDAMHNNTNESEDAEYFMLGLFRQLFYYPPYLAEEFRIIIAGLLCISHFTDNDERSAHIKKYAQHERFSIFLLSNLQEGLLPEMVEDIVTQPIIN